MLLDSSTLALDASENLRHRLFYLLMLYFDDVKDTDRQSFEAKVDHMLSSLVIEYTIVKNSASLTPALQ